MTTGTARRQKRQPPSDIPEALLEEILVRLPLKSLIEFKSVSKHWLVLINSNRFAFARAQAQTLDNPRASYLVLRNLNHHYDKKFITHISVGRAPNPRITRKRHPNIIDFKDVNVQVMFPLGFGILCGFEYREGIVLLCNPTTRETKLLPQSPYYVSCGANVCHFGIVGYDQCGGNFWYKVGRVTSVTSLIWGDVNQFRLSLEFYSSKTKLWKLKQDFCVGEYRVRAAAALTSNCANVNGRAHWMIAKSAYVMSFDYETEVFTKIRAPEPPEFVRRYDKWNPVVTLFDDKLLSLMLFWRGRMYADIWVMREYGVEDSWFKVYTLGPIPNVAEILGFSSKAQCIFLRHMHGLPTRLAIFDCESSDAEWFRLPGKPQDQFIKVVEHKESIVSLSI